jgi:hypothetical protein
MPDCWLAQKTKKPKTAKSFHFIEQIWLRGQDAWAMGDPPRKVVTRYLRALSHECRHPRPARTVRAARGRRYAQAAAVAKKEVEQQSCCCGKGCMSVSE